MSDTIEVAEDEMFEDVALRHISFPPTFSAFTYGGDVNGYELCLESSGRTVNSENLSRSFTRGLCVVRFPRRRTVEEVARDVVTAYAISEFHEGLEFVKVDGQRLAEPHPDPGEEEHWAWLVRRMSRVTKDYCETWPVGSRREFPHP